MRVAIVGFSVEIMLASPVETGLPVLQHFTPEQMRHGDVWMVRGVLARLAEEADIEAVPLYWATALPGGPTTPDAYALVKDKTLQLLRENGPFDGIVVVNHGALEVEGLDRDADTDFVSAIRAQAGADMPIAIALDLHGDMTPELLAAGTVFSVLRTAPHRDDKETGYRAADQLIRVIRQGLKPRKAAVRIPMPIPGRSPSRPCRRLTSSTAACPPMMPSRASWRPTSSWALRGTTGHGRPRPPWLSARIAPPAPAPRPSTLPAASGAGVMISACAWSMRRSPKGWGGP